MIGLKPEFDNHSTAKLMASAGGGFGRSGSSRGFGRSHTLTQQLSGRFFVSGISGSLNKHNKQLQDADRKYLKNGEDGKETDAPQPKPKYSYEPVLERRQREELRQEAQRLLEMEQQLEELQRMKELKRKRDRERRRKRLEFQAATTIQQAAHRFLQHRATAAATILIDFLRCTTARQAVSAASWAASVLKRFAWKASATWQKRQAIRTVAAINWSVIEEVASIWTQARRATADECVYHCIKMARNNATDHIVEQQLQDDEIIAQKRAERQARRNAKREQRERRLQRRAQRKQKKQQLASGGTDAHLQFFLTEFDSGGVRISSNDLGSNSSDCDSESDCSSGSSSNSPMEGSLSQKRRSEQHMTSPQQQQRRGLAAGTGTAADVTNEPARKPFRTFDATVERERRVIELHKRKVQEMQAEKARRLKEVEDAKEKKARIEEEKRQKIAAENKAKQEQRQTYLQQLKQEQAQRAKVAAQLRTERDKLKAQQTAELKQQQRERELMRKEDTQLFRIVSKQRRNIQRNASNARINSANKATNSRIKAVGSSSSSAAASADEGDWSEVPNPYASEGKSTGAAAGATGAGKEGTIQQPKVVSKRPGVPRLSAAATGLPPKQSAAQLKKKEEMLAIEEEIKKQEEERRKRFTSEEAVQRSRAAVRRRVSLKLARQSQKQKTEAEAAAERKEKLEKVAMAAQVKLQRDIELRAKREAEYRRALRKSVAAAVGGHSYDDHSDDNNYYDHSDEEDDNNHSDNGNTDDLRGVITSAHEAFEHPIEDFQLEEFLQQPSLVQLYSSALQAAQMLSQKADAAKADAANADAANAGVEVEAVAPAVAEAGSQETGESKQDAVNSPLESEQTKDPSPSVLQDDVLQESPTHHSIDSNDSSSKDNNNSSYHVNLAAPQPTAVPPALHDGVNSTTHKAATDNNHSIAVAVANAAASHANSATEAATAAAAATALKVAGRDITRDEAQEAQRIAKVVQNMPSNLQGTPYFSHFVKHAGKRVAKFEDNPVAVAAALAAATVVHHSPTTHAATGGATTSVGAGGVNKGNKQQPSGGRSKSKVPLLARKQQMQQIQRQQQQQAIAQHHGVDFGGDKAVQQATAVETDYRHVNAEITDEDLLQYKRQLNINSTSGSSSKKVNGLLSMVSKARRKLHQEETQAQAQTEAQAGEHHDDTFNEIPSHEHSTRRNDSIPHPPSTDSRDIHNHQHRPPNVPKAHENNPLLGSKSSGLLGGGQPMHRGPKKHNHPNAPPAVTATASVAASAEMSAFLKAVPSAPSLPPLSESNASILQSAAAAGITESLNGANAAAGAAAAATTTTKRTKKKLSSNNTEPTLTAVAATQKPKRSTAGAAAEGSNVRDQQQGNNKNRISLHRNAAAASKVKSKPRYTNSDAETGSSDDDAGENIDNKRNANRKAVHFQQQQPAAAATSKNKSTVDKIAKDQSRLDACARSRMSKVMSSADATAAYEKQLQSEYEDLRRKFSAKLQHATEQQQMQQKDQQQQQSVPVNVLPPQSDSVVQQPTAAAVLVETERANGGRDATAAAGSNLTAVASELERRRRRSLGSLQTLSSITTTTTQHSNTNAAANAATSNAAAKSVELMPGDVASKLREVEILNEELQQRIQQAVHDSEAAAGVTATTEEEEEAMIAPSGSVTRSYLEAVASADGRTNTITTATTADDADDAGTGHHQHSFKVSTQQLLDMWAMEDAAEAEQQQSEQLLQEQQPQQQSENTNDDMKFLSVLQHLSNKIENPTTITAAAAGGNPSSR